FAFETRELRSVCAREFVAVRTYGVQVAQGLKDRLADIEAATSVADLIVGNPRQLGEEMVVNLTKESRLVFCCNHSKTLTSNAGEIDWPSVSRIRLLRIEIDHV